MTERSGKKSWVHWRLQCPKFLRRTFVEWAAQTINRSFTVRTPSFKLIRILYRCWQTRTTYNETVYLNALSKRGSSLLVTSSGHEPTCGWLGVKFHRPIRLYTKE